MVDVILNRVKYKHNLAGAIRACACFGVDRLFWTGRRFSFDDGERLPREERMKGYRSVEVIDTERPFDQLPDGMVPVGIELMPTAAPLTTFAHPETACYVFGPEDGHLPQAFRRHCFHLIYIPSYHCLNLAAALNVVLAHRLMQQQVNGERPITDVGSMLKEHRGTAEIPSVSGWDGR